MSDGERSGIGGWVVGRGGCDGYLRVDQVVEILVEVVGGGVDYCGKGGRGEGAVFGLGEGEEWCVGWGLCHGGG